MKFLIVDDTPSKISEVKAILAKVNDGNCTIEVAETGLAARERLAETQYDLLILDIKLPLREGEEPDRKGGMTLLTEIMHSGRFLRPVHVVALTGFSDLRTEFNAKFTDGHWTIDTYEPGEFGWRDRLKAKADYIANALNQVGQAYETDLCVVTALATPELDAVRAIESWHFGAPESLDQVSYMYRGQFSVAGRSYSVAAAAAPRMGMVAAAALTQKMIQRVRPRLLAMTGICAGVRDACHLGDILVADPSWDWQMGKYLKETFEVAPDQLPTPLEISQRMNILRKDRAMLIELSEHYSGDKPNQIPNIEVGPVASGSAVLADQETAETIRKQHRKLLGVDMELYGVASAARDAGLPRPLAFGLKSVCDFADHLKNDKYQKYCSYMSAQVLRVFMERYAHELIPVSNR
ncbi:MULTISPECIES: response regulator [unclassified Bradyrhizobium]|uniref:phosphorylase family protein n=1 Tax=unclassified Bradyrhizobium TaxID=2631580 RepID=UPI001BAA0936|nr:MULTISPECIES: response regulator [unclassified Bradyrhizobium]MBR1208752.1 response regulator [Bradyrhizobium sp. AUGA SZCCT0124]MBR1316945.1 response regulator [Bradyrhizobium sp. AUGA SZCCT0051]MBR1345259.1 response regulator [Bradyrhizobium sp. AUGA SZCCT0105]MBR1360039.1 response regulator [Bradyrhizobium sp. AUGA SZCCT0045]